MMYTWSTVTLWNEFANFPRINFRYLFVNLERSLHERFIIDSFLFRKITIGNLCQIDFDPRCKFQRTKEKLLKLINVGNTSSQILSRIYFTLYPFVEFPSNIHTLHTDLIRIQKDLKSKINFEFDEPRKAIERIPINYNTNLQIL